MSWIDKIKLLFLVLQKGSELGNKEAWKNVAAVTLVLAGILNTVVGMLPGQWQALFTDEVQAMVVAVVANAGCLLVVLYLHFATSKTVGLSFGSGPRLGATRGAYGASGDDGTTSLSGWALVVAKVKTYFAITLNILPKVVNAILVVEGLFPGAGQGAAKLEKVRIIIEGAYAIISDGLLTFDEVWPRIKKFIDSTVSQFNKAGWPAEPPAA